jgi:hypothetical protein
MKVDPGTLKKNKDLKEVVLLGNKVDIMPASEPSNVIWENLEVTQKTQRNRLAVVFTIIFIFIIVTFLAFTAMKYLAG